MAERETDEWADPRPGDPEIPRMSLRAMSLAMGLLSLLLAVIISIWSRSTNFASEFWLIYHSLHPSVYTIDMLEPTLLRHALGVLIDAAYAFIDGFLLGSFLAVFYNVFLPKATR